MKSGEIVIITQVDVGAVLRNIGEEQMVVHGRWSRPRDLIGHGRGGRHEVPHV